MMVQVISLLSIILLCLIDQLIKWFVKVHLVPLDSVTVIPGVLEWKYVENTGAAFGSLSDNTFLLSVVTSALILCCLAALLSGKIKDKVYVACMILITAGGLSNLIDRMFRGTVFFCGYVIDYINVLFVDFAVFNFADCLITVGCFAAIIYILIGDKLKKRKNND